MKKIIFLFISLILISCNPHSFYVEATIIEKIYSPYQTSSGFGVAATGKSCAPVFISYSTPEQFIFLLKFMEDEKETTESHSVSPNEYAKYKVGDKITYKIFRWN